MGILVIEGEPKADEYVPAWGGCALPHVWIMATAVMSLLLVAPTTAAAGRTPSADDARPPANGALCLSCHSAAVAGPVVTAPRLAGQNPDYLAHALSMFKAGTRSSPIMEGVARSLSDDDIENLAVYFSMQKPQVVSVERPEGLVDVGKMLAQKGRVPDVPACFSCHGPQGMGNGARYPGIAGQPAAFTVARLHAFQLRARTGPANPGTMTAVAATLDDHEIEAAAAFLSALPH